MKWLSLLWLLLITSISVVSATPHNQYPSFSSSEGRSSLLGTTLLLTDDAIYKTGYYSINGATWIPFTLTGNNYPSSIDWLAGTATASLPASLLGLGEHYIIIYSCTYNNEWDCHGNNWQLHVITNEPLDDDEEDDVPSVCDCAAGYYCANDVCLMNVSGNTYFVAPNGNDTTGNGGFNNPWASFQKAVHSMSPGDITYFRGGSYNQTTTIHMAYSNNGKSGTKENPIRYFNYPGETPVFDGTYRQFSSNGFRCLSLFDKSYIHFKGLKFVNFLQIKGETSGVHCIYDQSSHDIIYEHMVLQNIGGVGFHTHDSYGISYMNCDASDLSDPFTPYTETGAGGPGNNGAGFRFTSYKIFNSSYAPISYYGCRAWNASDDGFHGQYAGLVVLDHCWSMNNGYLPMGGGAGFKLGWFDHDIEPLTRLVKNCIAANNKVRGFHENNAGSGRPNMFIYNNFAYNNTDGFVSWNYALYPENENIYRNNLGFANRGLDGYASLGYVHSHNSWDLPFSAYHPYKNPPSVSDDDFVSLDSSQLFLPRKADGSLPDITFGHLREGSDLIDRGIDVGLPYMGAAPDLGAFETPYTAPPYTMLSACGLLSSPGRLYVLTSDVTSSGTCFTIGADNVVLDCDGHTITYSTGGAANTMGVFTNKFNTTIKNCNVIEGDQQSSNSDRHGIFLHSASNSSLLNNTVTTNNQRTVYLYQSSNNILEGNNVISTTGLSIVLIAAHNNFLNDNRGVSDENTGFFLYSSSNNILISNYAKSNNRGMFLSSSANNNSFINQTSIGGAYGIDISGSSNNLFKDCALLEGGISPVRISENAHDNVFDNCDY